MNLYIWRHSTFFSSWSVMEELKISTENYSQAEVTVLAESYQQALKVLEVDGKWNIEDLKSIDPEVVALDVPRIIKSTVR